jgi:hypothetical protein
MAEQVGMFPLRGSVGNINFFKLGGRYFARGKGGVSADRFATDPKFQRSRESSNEFGVASRAGKLLRTAFLALGNADKFMARRLRTAMISVLQADTRSARGMRSVTTGKVTLLEGFEFNEHGALSHTLVTSYTSDINRETGEMKISIPAFIAHEQIKAPAAATHFKLISGGAEMDFENGKFSVVTDSSAELPLNNVTTDEIILKNTVQANSTHPLFLALGVEFYQELNGSLYRLRDETFNALAIVKVSAW